MNNPFYRSSQFVPRGGDKAGASVPSPSGAPAVVPERVAELFDEGANAARAAELHEVARQYTGDLISNLEGIVVRAEQSAQQRRQ